MTDVNLAFEPGWLAKRTATVRERVMRLNPPPMDNGKNLRGYHPQRRLSNYLNDRVGKGKFIRMYGRAAWDALPRCCIVHDGRRKAVERRSIEDEMWKLPVDHPMRRI